MGVIIHCQCHQVTMGWQCDKPHICQYPQSWTNKRPVSGSRDHSWPIRGQQPWLETTPQRHNHNQGTDSQCNPKSHYSDFLWEWKQNWDKILFVLHQICWWAPSGAEMHSSVSQRNINSQHSNRKSDQVTICWTQWFTPPNWYRAKSKITDITERCVEP